MKVVLQDVYSQVCDSFSEDTDEDGNAIAYSTKDILKKIKAVVNTYAHMYIITVYIYTHIHIYMHSFSQVKSVAHERSNIHHGDT